MIFSICHETRYRYDQPVALDPHLIRLVPRSDPNQFIRMLDIQVVPEPHGRAFVTDAEGNCGLSVWFSGMTTELAVTSRCTVETTRTNPFDYLVQAPLTELPVSLPESERAVIAPYLQPVASAPEVESFALEILNRAERHTLRFLSLLNETLSRDFSCGLRETGDPFLPAECLAQRGGACRDLTVLFIEVCRIAGIPARFVSGYQEGDLDMTHRHLHAWPEVYLPGAGWRGYDPTTGLAVADRHIALAASFQPGSASPIVGTYRGPAVGAEMTYSLQMDLTPGPALSSA